MSRKHVWLLRNNRSHTSPEEGCWPWSPHKGEIGQGLWSHPFGPVLGFNFQMLGRSRREAGTHAGFQPLDQHPVPLSHRLTIPCRRSSCDCWTPRSWTSCTRGGRGHWTRACSRAVCFWAKQTQEAECREGRATAIVQVASPKAEEAGVAAAHGGPAGAGAHDGWERKPTPGRRHLPRQHREQHACSESVWIASKKILRQRLPNLTFFDVKSPWQVWDPQKPSWSDSWRTWIWRNLHASCFIEDWEAEGINTCLRDHLRQGLTTTKQNVA